MKKHLVVMATLLFLMAVPASAQYWGVPGSTGDVDESAASIYEKTGASLKFKSASTGTIVARYPIWSPVSANPGWTALGVAFGGPGVSVRVIELSHCLRFEDEIASQTFTATDQNSCEPLSISHTWDFANYSYYVEVTLTRGSTSTNPQLHQLHLQ